VNPDNLGFDRKGHLLIQEDPGNNVHRAAIVAYDTKTGDRAVLAQFDSRFGRPRPPARLPHAGRGVERDHRRGRASLGSNTFLFDAQVHKAQPGRRQGRARAS
jgi:hypothetical protein